MLTDRFEQALVYATQLHATQTRKVTGVPYISHLLGVTSIAMEHGADEDESIAALLHDAVEDQGGAATLAVIEREYGPRVAAIVDGCTDTDQSPKPPWRQRKEAYIARVNAGDDEHGRSIRLVSCADKVYNARTILADHYRLEGEIWQRFTGGKQGTLWYYRTLHDAYSRFGATPLTDELDRVVSQLEQRAAAEP